MFGVRMRFASLMESMAAEEAVPVEEGQEVRDGKRSRLYPAEQNQRNQDMENMIFDYVVV
jgi:hypothetical protein